MGLRWIGRLALLLAILVAATGLVGAQSADLTLDDNGCNLDESAIEAAASRLEAKGAHVVVVCTDSAGGEPLDYLDERLSAHGIGSGHTESAILDNALVYFVSNEPRYVSVSRGQGWSDLTTGEIEEVRVEHMVPQLQRGDTTAAFVDALAQTNSEVTRLRSSSSGNGGGGGGVVRTPAADTGTSPFLWVLLGLVALGMAGAFIIPPFLRRRQQKETAATAIEQARSRYEAARLGAGAAISDVGKLLDEAKLKQKYDVASYSHDDVQWLALRQAQGEQLFVRAQHEFDRVEERMQLLPNPAEQDYNSAAAEYERVRDTAMQARVPIEQTEARRAELDLSNREAPGEVGGIKKS